MRKFDKADYAFEPTAAVNGRYPITSNTSRCYCSVLVILTLIYFHIVKLRLQFHPELLQVIETNTVASAVERFTEFFTGYRLQ